jgi:hypothetical protein
MLHWALSRNACHRTDSAWWNNFSPTTCRLWALISSQMGNQQYSIPNQLWQPDVLYTVMWAYTRQSMGWWSYMRLWQCKTQSGSSLHGVMTLRTMYSSWIMMICITYIYLRDQSTAVIYLGSLGCDPIRERIGQSNGDILLLDSWYLQG